MAKTGERYSAARAQILRSVGIDPTVTDGYPYRTGVCSDTAAVRNLLEHVGVRAPDGAPLSEAMVYGLAGGVGFLYVVFEYQGTPPLLSVLTRYDTAADQFTIGALRRLGLGLDVAETTSAAKARRTLDAALEDRPVACVFDSGTMRDVTLPGTMAGMAPTIAVVTAAPADDDDGYRIDAGDGHPIERSADAVDGSRAAYKSAKRRCAVIGDPGAVNDLGSIIHDAIGDTLHRYEHAPYKGFKSNFGFAGMEKWVKLLVDERSAKGWPKQFPDGALTCLALRRTYQGLEYEMTGPGAGRAMYAAFLEDAAEITGHEAYRAAAEAYTAAGAAWSDVAAFVAGCGLAEVEAGCAMLDAYMALLDERADAASRADVSAQIRGSGAGCDVTPDDARALYAELATHVREATAAERVAFDALCGAHAPA